MFLFIAIIFIAELIIAATLILFIVKADRAVVSLHRQAVAVRPQIKAVLEGVKAGIKEVNEKQEIVINYLRKKRNQWIVNMAKTIIVYLLLFLFKGKCKKAASICQGLLLVKDVWDSIPG